MRYVLLYLVKALTWGLLLALLLPSPAPPLALAAAAASLSLIAYLAGDLLVLRLLGRVAALLADFLLVYLFLMAVDRYALRTGLRWEQAIGLAAWVALAEVAFHRLLASTPGFLRAGGEGERLPAGGPRPRGE